MIIAWTSTGRTWLQLAGETESAVNLMGATLGPGEAFEVNGDPIYIVGDNLNPVF